MAVCCLNVSSWVLQISFPFLQPKKPSSNAGLFFNPLTESSWCHKKVLSLAEQICGIQPNIFWRCLIESIHNALKSTRQHCREWVGWEECESQGYSVKNLLTNAREFLARVRIYFIYFNSLSPIVYLSSFLMTF